MVTQPDPKSHEISTISLQQLQKDGQREDMFVFSVMTTPSPTVQTSSTPLPSKYLEFGDVFDKGKATTLPGHHPYDCPIDLQPGKDPPWGPIYNLSPSKL